MIHTYAHTYVFVCRNVVISMFVGDANAVYVHVYIISEPPHPTLLHDEKQRFSFCPGQRVFMLALETLSVG